MLLKACEQSDPPIREGDMIEFSGMLWKIKHPEGQDGPGPNYFSGSLNDVFVDEKGRLHLKIAKYDDKWYATEVIGQQITGYGTYIFTIIGDLINIPENIVLGLFTWDPNTFYEQANSEVDIEFSKWGIKENKNTLTYSVQPVNFGTFYPERTHSPELDKPEQLIGVSTHAFIWTDTLITWRSYTGYEYGKGELIAEWSFDLSNPARVKTEGGQSSLPVIIPEPDSTTNPRINLWILPYISPAPADGKEHEIIIHSFQYIPL